ncbi:MAG: hypothetical protein MUF22_02140 [Chitinispirillaceae bacterium]|jgi:hypothetical protein|nr:hypothetical protein [Chitinispirillaceae bacterium]
MNTIKKWLMILGAGVLGTACILLLFKTKCHHRGVYEKVGKGIDEKIKESKTALDKAAGHIQSVFDHAKGPAK